ncbi:ClbS/DfsB family four-helix bundle protein [Chryseobacterium sp.]|uniref:ClbS/DfsB family four-helix bundle protein n=1 Tax=Chryseobacterium sp. TaxID=1871047 RepID=UPI0025C42688|nr:ClbS/DfsB family four-helix bundle protein [Chryseobacterium sp.]
MTQYLDKTELIKEIKKRYTLYDEEFDEIDESLKDVLKAGIAKTPSQNISYQIGWTSLLLQWESDEQKGIEVKTPTSEYKWNNLGGLYQSFYETFGVNSLSQQREILNRQVKEILLWIEKLDHDTLFLPQQRKWATTSAKWPLWKWIHINTVAPFKTFRSQIKKWKKEIDTE